MGQMSNKPKNFEKIRSPKVEICRNRWPTYGCEVRDGDFWEDIWVWILVSILSILLPKYWYYIDTYFRRYFPSLVSLEPVVICRPSNPRPNQEPICQGKKNSTNPIRTFGIEVGYKDRSYGIRQWSAELQPCGPIRTLLAEGSKKK